MRLPRTLLPLSLVILFGVSAQAATPKPARVKADPARVALGDVQPGGSVPVRIHLVNTGGSVAAGVVCSGRGLQFPAVDVPAGGAADTEATYTAPATPTPKKPKPVSIAIRCGKASVTAKATLVPPATASTAVDVPQPATDRLLGVWKIKSMAKGDEKQDLPEGVHITLEFKADRTMTMVVSVEGEKDEQQGTWELAGGDRIKITFDGKTEELLLMVNATTLTMRNPADNETLEAVR